MTSPCQINGADFTTPITKCMKQTLLQVLLPYPDNKKTNADLWGVFWSVSIDDLKPTINEDVIG